MKRKWAILAIIFFIISIIAAFSIFTLTQINTPKVTVNIDVVQLTEENVGLNFTMQLDNKNSYNLVLEEMTVEVLGMQGNEIGTLVFPRKTVPAHDSITLETTGLFGFKDEPLEKFNSHISGNFGVDFYGFISLSLPLDITIATDPAPVVDTIILPTISTNTAVERINETGALLNGNILINNQNDFAMSLINTTIVVKHNGTPINAEISISDAVIEPRSQDPINFSAFVGYEVFDSGTLTALLSGNVNIALAGISFDRPFTAATQINVPDIASFVMNNDHIEISLSADFDITASGIDMNVGFRLYNPMKIPLIASELGIIIYRVDEEARTIIAEDYLQNCPLPAENETCLNTTFRLPIISFLPVIGDGIPDWFLLTLVGDFTIADSNQKIPVQINGFLSGNFFLE